MGRRLRYHYKENHKRMEEQRVPSHRFRCFKRTEFTFPLQQASTARSSRISLRGKREFSRAERCFPLQQQDLPTARPSKQLLDTPRAAASTGTDVCFNYSDCVLLLHVAQITHPRGIIHSKGLFHPSQQNEKIQLQPLTGPVYCYL